jgi:beta-glucosidase
MHKTDFGESFLWGTATAAYQIEGAANLDGRGKSVWDTFSHTPGKVKNGDTGDQAADFYHRYPQDIALIKQMHLRVHRFSLAWPRILPDGRGSPNTKGLDFYHRVIDRTLELGLEPWPTLYHWDLPQPLEDLGGWTNRDIVGWFSDYAEVCAKAFGDKVKHWMVLNEPTVFTLLGYMQGVHAPGRKGFLNFLPAVHHTALAQAAGGKVLRSVPGSVIGTTFSASYVQPGGPTWLSKIAAANFDVIANRLFLEPALGLGYPWKTMPALLGLKPYIRPGDMEQLSFDFDFIGLQTYFRQVVRFDLTVPGIWGRDVAAKEASGTLTEMGWEVYPPNLYHLLKQLAAYPQIKRIIVTENGAAFRDVVDSGRVHDTQRQQFIESHLQQLLKAKQEGVPVDGYLVWSLLDNFEWAEGYRPRFGLVHVDYATQQRTLKDSALWLRDFLA